MYSMLKGNLKSIDLTNFFYQDNIIHNYQEILYEIEYILRNKDKISKQPINARVFINGGTRDDLGLLISNLPPNKSESLYHWMQRVTQSDSFCVALNGINGWSDKLSNIVSKHFNREWISTFGIPTQGIDVYSFMGKYSLTPFGIHSDKEHTFLYHLGPNIKKAWLWDPSVFESDKLINESFNLNYLSEAIQIDLLPGSILFIPQGWFHVLENPEFSVTLGIAPYENKKSELMKILISNYIIDNSPNDEYMFFRTENDLKFPEPNILRKELSEIYNLEIQKHLHLLKSNSYFKYTSPSRNISNKEYKILKGTLILKNNEMYCRGKKFTIKNSNYDKYKKIILSLNHDKFTYTPKINNALPIDLFFNEMIKLGVLI